MTDERYDHIYNVLLSMILGIFLAVTINSMFTSPRMIYRDER